MSCKSPRHYQKPSNSCSGEEELSQGDMESKSEKKPEESRKMPVKTFEIDDLSKGSETEVERIEKIATCSVIPVQTESVTVNVLLQRGA